MDSKANMPITIVAGENIPYVRDACAHLGALTIMPGREIAARHLRDTRILLARSTTTINRALLDGTAVTFVGSASAGIDHVDQAYLRAREIAFASSPGANANSVAEYVMTALLTVAARDGVSLEGKTIGIIGVGHIGSLVNEKAEALSLRPVLNDPPRADDGGFAEHRPLEEALACDIVTIHTPLTVDGPYPTYHLLNERTLQALKPSTILVNAARGEVIDSHALLHAIRSRRVGPVIVDAWEREPNIPWELFDEVAIGTPHIAGHSLDGKAKGTFMVYDAACRHLGVPTAWAPEQSLPPPLVPEIDFDPGDQPVVMECLRRLATAVYDIEADHARMKAIAALPDAQRAAGFDHVRTTYPVRREFPGTRIRGATLDEVWRRRLTVLGFQCNG